MLGFRAATDRFTAALLLVATACAAATAQTAEPVAVEVVNASHPTRCAEEDNVYVKLVGADISSFRLAVRHPAYIGDVAADSTAPDFSQCDMSHDPSFPFTPRDVVLYDDGRYRLMGHTYKSNWRPEVVPFRVVGKGAGKEERGLHLVQLLEYVDGAPIELVVLYPADGYWRAKPLPPLHHPETAYGSSFLFGPIEEQGRPLVRFSDIEFDPGSLTFRLHYAGGGAGRLTVAAATPDGLDLDIAFDAVSGAGKPFAALRSMFVTPAQADVSEASWHATPGGGEETHPILDFTETRASEVRFGRSAKSQHNLSAPDFVFGDFRRVAGP
jgi:hypothetical protein